MIAPRYPLCDLLRREHRLVRLALMASYVGDATSSATADDAEAVRSFIIGHLRFEDRLVVPAIRTWLPCDWSTGDARLVESWCQARSRRDANSVRRALAAISRRIADEERVLLPLIELHIAVDEQHDLIDKMQFATRRDHTRVVGA
jgi:hypothetical protein